jgi:E3 ubiquitin-protein ligase MARCH6
VFFLNTFGLRDPNNIQDGTFRRVPASDNVALPREMRATAEVNVNGEPVNETAAKLIQLQNAEAEKAKRNVKADYTIVYIPPHFRYRTMLFILIIWVAFAIFLAAAFSLPILLGRSFFKLFTARDIHDGYSFITGFYLLWACYLVGKAVDRMDKRRQRRGHDGPRAEFPIFFIKRCLLWLAKISYMLFFLGLIIPILISLVMDFYIVLPIRLAVNPTLQPRIRVVDTWALGLLYAKIAVQAHHFQHPTAVMRGLNNIVNNGWTHPDLVAATREVIGPVTGGLTLLLLFPPAILWASRQFFLLPVGGKLICE